MNQFEESEFFEQMLLQLRGEARQVIINYINQYDSNWLNIKAKIFSHFVHLANKDISNSQLENLKQEKDESLTKFAERARKML